MESRLFEGLRKDVAQQYVNLYERITLITGEVCALAKAIEVLSIQDNFGDVGLGYFGSIINEKCREIDTLLDGFVSYPTIYLELKERKAGRGMARFNLRGIDYEILLWFNSLGYVR